ncbi:MAG: sensor histidine kinase, partial [Promethearchaeota archaeon]
MIILIDSHGMIIDVNTTFLTKLGNTKEDLIGKDFRNIEGFAIRNLSLFKEKFNELLMPSNIEPFEIQAFDKDDKLKWVNIQVSWINVGSKKLLQVIIQDIDALKKSQTNLETLVNSIYDFLFVIDFGGNILKVNNVVLNRLGYTQEEILNMTLLDLHPSDRHDEAKTIVAQMLEDKTDSCNIPIVTKSGELIPVETKISKGLWGEKEAFFGISRDITKRIKYEQKLKESEEKFRTMAENSLIGISITQNSQIKYVNKKNAEIMGYSPNEMLNWDFKDIFKHIYPEDLPRVRKNMEIFTLELEERSNQIDHRVITKAGKVIWVDNFSARIHYEGKPARLVATVDITDRKIAEQRLKESEERFRTLFEVAPASIMVADLDSNILMCNERFWKLHGFESPELVKGRKFPEFISKKDRSKLAEGVKATLDGKSRDVISYNMLKNDGTEFPAEATSSAIKDKDGKTIGIIGVAQDITKRKKAEQIVKESEEKFRTITEQSFMGVIILQDEKLKYVNEAAAKIFEYSSEEVMNWSKNHMVEKSIHPEDLLILREKRELRRRGEFNLKPYISYRVITKSGKIRWIDQFSRIIDYQGKEAELISIIDITDQKEAEKIITEENKMLVELDQMRKELLTRVSHELKTPLVSIFSCSELLIDYYQEQMSEEVMKFVEIIHRGGKRLKDLIKNLLDA